MTRVALRAVLALAFVGSLGPLLPKAALAHPGPGDERPFKHTGDHVPSLLERKQDEVARDCRGCHDYAAADGALGVATCRACHYVDSDRGSPFMNGSQWQAVERPKYAHVAETPAFAHVDHLRLACLECHATGGDPIGVKSGVGECMRCHAPDAADRLLAKPASDPAALRFLVPSADAARGLKNGFLEQLNRSPRMAPRADAAFRHRDHLDHPDRARALTRESGAAGDAARTECARCHANVFDAAGVEDVWRYSSEACGACHRDSAQQPTLHFAPRATERTQVAVDRPDGGAGTAGTFLHGDHLRGQPKDPADPRARAEDFARIAGSGCYACHVYRAEAEGDRFVLQESPTYEWCARCHTQPDWQSAHHRRPLAERWTQDRCVECHRFPSADMRGERALATVTRPAQPRFESPSQRHPFLTAGFSADSSGGEGAREDCGVCHASWVTDMPSRLSARRDFRHDSHLSDPARADQCDECHQDLRKASTSQDLVAVFDRTTGNVFDAGKCVSCHKDSTITVAPLAEQPTREVTQFSHASHLQKDHQDPLDCLRCHDPGNEAAQGRVGVIASVAQLCQPCHDHGERALATGHADRAEVNSCVKCHRPDGAAAEHASIPARGVTPSYRVPAFTEVGRQVHEADRPCAGCHVAGAGQSVVAMDHFFATGPQKDVHQGENQNRYPRAAEGRVCLACHWQRVPKGARLDPRDPRIRQDIGADLGLYGIESARKVR